jgi:hypothetical protein
MVFYDFFRTGQFCWGYDLNNPTYPFFHVTEHGRRTLQQLSRDPANPEGYMHYLEEQADLNDIALSYIEEGLRTYNVGCYKATAVMVGAAAERVALEVRDDIVNRIEDLGGKPAKELKDWRIKTVLDAMQKDLESRKSDMERPLADALTANWPSFTHEIRAARNEAGHPSSIDPVTPETVHASLLIFPQLAKLASDLRGWIPTGYK